MSSKLLQNENYETLKCQFVKAAKLDNTWKFLKQRRYLGSAQKDFLSSSGTTNVRFKNRATVTMSQIWNAKSAKWIFKFMIE